MNVTRFDEEAIFHVACSIAPGEARDAYLEQVCGGDATLRRRVEALLRVCEEEASFLEAPPYDATADVPGPIAEQPGTIIGPYKLLEVIGEGGMGVVYLAEQSIPVRRKVALKVIKPGMDSKQVVARFEAERQALAMMDHPNIAKVLDGGMTPEGRPYFVMELVRGIPITEYCDKARLSVRERLELFAHVCHAVQHAHQKGIIHRDLKPTNVLVTQIDGNPVPKVIDFGVAKAMGQRLTEKTLFTGLFQLVGTPAYMSPEQAALSGIDADTRSDIYSLGVLLYELLTGSTPIDQRMIKAAALDEIRRLVREVDPPTPSTRLSTLGDACDPVSAARRTDPHRLRSALSGDLDWIVMKCLEKNCDRRYETANGLAADIRRHLANEPVLACPPSTFYRIRKFVNRNRVAMSMAGLVAGFVLVLSVVSTISAWYYLRLARSEADQRLRADSEAQAAVTARTLANVRAAEAETARADADRRATEAQEVVDFLINDLIGSASPDQKQGKTVTVDEVLERADKNIAEKFKDQPLAEAGIRRALGNTYEALGRYQKSKEHLERSVKLYKEHLGPEHADTLKASTAYGWALLRLNEKKPAEALFESIREASLRTLGAEDPVTLLATHSLATSLDDAERAISMLEELLPVRRRVQGAASKETLSTMNNLALRYSEKGRYADARRLYDEMLRLRPGDDPKDTDTVRVMSNLLSNYDRTGEKPRQELITRYERMTEASEKLLGFEHPNTNALRNMHFWSLLRSQDRRQKLDAAHELVDRTIERAERELGFKHDVTQWWYEKREYLMTWDYRPISELLAYHESYSKRVREAFGPDAAQTVGEMQTLGSFLLAAHRWEEARALYRQLNEVLEKAPEKNLRAIMDHKLTLAILDRNGGHPDQAEILIADVRKRATDLDQVELANMISRNRYGPGRSDSPDAQPAVPMTLNAPFRERSPVLDGRIEPNEYGSPLSVEFTDTRNPGRLCDWKGTVFLKNVYTTKTPDDLSYRVLAAHTGKALYLAVQVRDQFIDDQEFDRQIPQYNDHVEFFINGDLDANDAMHEMAGTTPYRGSSEGFQLLCDAAGHHLATLGLESDDMWSVATGRTPEGYIIEIEIPLNLIDTRDGPESVPPKTGSFLLMNVAVADNDEYVSAMTNYAALWNDGEKTGASFYFLGEDFWTIGLRLTPGGD